MKRSIFAAAALAAALNAAAGLDALFYHPDSTVYRTPAADGYAFEPVRFASADGTRLTGWFIPAQGEALGTVVHFHGNAQNMTAHYAFVSWLPANGFNLFVFDYRGYGASEGTPSRDGVVQDGAAAMRHIKGRTDIDQTKIIVLGQSIGAATALAVLGGESYEGVVGVVSDSAFSTYKSVASDHAGVLKPAAWVAIGNTHSPKKAIAHIAPTPLLIIHGTADRVVDVKHADKLFKAAGEPKQLWKIKGGGHTCALGALKQTYAPRLRAQFVQWVAAPAAPTTEGAAR